MGTSLFLAALLLLAVVAGIAIFWPRKPRRRDPTVRDHTEFKYDDRSYLQHPDNSSTPGPHDS